MVTDEDFEKAIGLLYTAKEQRSAMYLKGCVNYILKMKPNDMETGHGKNKRT